MTLQVGDKVHHVQVAPGSADTVVEAVSACTIEGHQNEEGGPCGEIMVTVTDPVHNQPFSAHEDNFAKIEETEE